MSASAPFSAALCTSRLHAPFVARAFRGQGTSMIMELCDGLKLMLVSAVFCQSRIARVHVDASGSDAEETHSRSRMRRVASRSLCRSQSQQQEKIMRQQHHVRMHSRSFNVLCASFASSAICASHRYTMSQVRLRGHILYQAYLAAGRCRRVAGLLSDGL